MSSPLLLALLSTCVYAAMDGLALTPPQGWRDWNEFQCKITQAQMEQTMDLMVDTSRGPSLLQLGYSDVGLGELSSSC